MAREIVSQHDLPKKAARESSTAQQPDRYVDRLMKYIPGEIVALYVLLDGSIKNGPDGVPVQALLWGVFAILLVGTWFYLRRVQQVKKTTQLVVSMIAFAVWVFYLGGPFEEISEHSEFYGHLLLPLYTFMVGLIEPKAAT